MDFSDSPMHLANRGHGNKSDVISEIEKTTVFWRFLHGCFFGQYDYLVDAT